MSKTLKLMSLVLAAAGLVFLGCEEFGGVNNDPGGDAPATIASFPPFTEPIMAGQSIEVGEVTITFTVDGIEIEYLITDFDWWFTQLHADVALSWEGLDKNPGKMLYSYDADSFVAYTFYIPWNDSTRYADELWLATHCVVWRYNEQNELETQTGWAGTDSWTGKGKWWKWWHLKNYKTLRMPVWNVVGNCKYYWTSLNSEGTPDWVYFIPYSTKPHDVPRGEYNAYCLMADVSFPNLTLHGHAIWPYQDDLDTIPWVYYCRDGVTPIPYPWITYLINKPTYWPDSLSAAEQLQLQHVIWYWVGDYDYDDLTSDEKAIEAEADDHDDYYPSGRGAWFPIILADWQKRWQLVFIEVDP